MAQINLRESETRKMYEKWASLPPFALSLKGISPGLNYVVKVDETISGRYKKGLIRVDVGKKEVEKFIKEKKKDGYNNFIIEPYIKIKNEKYVSFECYPDYDLIRYSDHGGIDIEKNWSTIKEMRVDLLIDQKDISFPDEAIKTFYQFFVENNFSFLEINPYGYVGNKLYAIDFKARIDDCGNNSFKTSTSGLTKKEEYIQSLGETTSASLKFKMLNPNGRVWPLIAGGGASILYFDLINKKFGSNEVAFDGEYSGNPSTQLLYKYSSTIISLMLSGANKSKKNKVLVIGGGNANFTYIPATFKGIIQAISEHVEAFVQQGVTVIIRRAGPHDIEGLEMMKDFLNKNKIKNYVYGIDVAIGDTFNQYLKSYGKNK